MSHLKSLILKPYWFQRIAQFCSGHVANSVTGNSSNSIMRIINQVIISTGIEKSMVSQTTIRTKMENILLKESEDHKTKGQKVIGMDGKCDKTLAFKG